MARDNAKPSIRRRNRPTGARHEPPDVVVCNIDASLILRLCLNQIHDCSTGIDTTSPVRLLRETMDFGLRHNVRISES